MMGVENSKVKVLIVDNIPENLEAAGEILRKEDYDIYTADSIQQSIELLSKIQADIILVDLNMSVMDGFEISKHIKDNHELESIPVIFLTDKADAENVEKVFEYGAVDYISKPFNANELTARVRNYSELKRTKEELKNKNIKLEEAHAELQRIATTDPLTKLINRREMLRKIDYEIIRFERNKNKFSLVMADIDFFRKVNDDYGHECGDFVLKGVADILREGIRKQDFIARWGGEEFLLLLPETTQEGASVLAEKIRNRIEQVIFKYNGNDIKITMTFGVRDYIEDKEGNEIVRLANRALCIGKENGRNCVALSSQK